MKLSQALQTVNYESSWGIWAQKVDGLFTAESDARFGQVCFENGGLLDCMEFVCNGEHPHDWDNSCNEGLIDVDSFADIDVLIDELNA